MERFKMKEEEKEQKEQLLVFNILKKTIGFELQTYKDFQKRLKKSLKNV